MEYGFIVTKNDELFFVHRVEESNIVLIPSYDTSIKINDIPDQYTIVYKPKLRGVCELNNFYLNNQIVLHYGDTKRQGKIVKKNKDMIHVFFSKENTTEVLDFNYKGFPSKIDHIEKINMEPSRKPNKNNIEQEENEEIKEEEEDEDDDIYYFSLEQQIQQLVENFRKQMEDKYLNKIISHYIELNKKYFTYENNYIFKKLKEKPIYSTILNGDSIFHYYTRHLKSYYYRDENFVPNNLNEKLKKKIFEHENYPVNMHFFEQVDQFSLVSNDNTNISHREINRINKNNLDHLLIETSKKNKSTYNGSHYTNVWLEDMSEVPVDGYDHHLYPIKTNTEFIIDGVVIPSEQKINHYMKQSKMNQMIHKISEPQYKKEYYVNSELNDDPCIFTKQNQIIKKDSSKEFYTFLNSIIPNTRYLLKCLDITYYNVYHYIKLLSIFDIYELSKLDYDYIKRLVSMNIRSYKSRKIEKNTIKEYSTNSFIMNSMSKPDELKDRFYSSSELFQISLYENHTLLMFDLIKQNLDHKLDTTNSSIKQVIDEFKQQSNAIDTTIYYDKIYYTRNEVSTEQMPIFMDLTSAGTPITNVRDPFIKSSSIIWNEIDKSKFKSFEQFEIILKQYVSDMDESSILKSYKTKIQDWFSNYNVVSGSKGYVLETNETFVYENRRWVLYSEKELVKGSKQLNSYINKRIDEITKEDSTNSLKKSQMNRDDYVNKSKYYVSMFNPFMKYNQMKRIYSQNYSSVDVKFSPHQPMFDKILQIESNDEKNKAIKIFCEQYTTEGSDPYWLYCIETETKLVPMFIKTLAYSTNYNETIQKICYEQGKQEDEYWVDKYSGYTIIKIDFNEQEGYTSDGFKMVSREIIPTSEPTTSVDKKNIMKDIETILNAIGVPISHGPSIYKEYNNIQKNLSKHSLLLYSIIFIYIQANVNTSEITTSFYSCKTSFDGFPMVKDENQTKGIEYMICIYKALKNIKKAVDKNDFIKLIKNVLKNRPMLNQKLSIIKKESYSKDNNKSWELFLPRMASLTISKVYDAYYKSFKFQEEMNKIISEIEPTEKLSNGSYKVINNYVKNDKVIEPIKKGYVSKEKFKKANLYYYPQVTKPDQKFEITEPTYSLEKINRIMENSSYSEISDELLKEVKKKLHSKKQINPVKSKESYEEKTSMSKEERKTKEKYIEDYLSIHSGLNLNKLLEKIEGLSKKRKDIVTSRDEKDKMTHSILYNLLNEIQIMSKMKDSATYENPKLRPYFASLLNVSDQSKLIEFIKNSFNSLEKVEPKTFVSHLSFSLKEQILMYKYYLCELYKNASQDERTMYEQMIGVMIKKLVIKVDIIKKNNEQAKYKEKKEITDKFKEMSDESRNVEFMLKQSKLGDWSLGLSKSIYKYNKDAPSKEQEDEEEEMDPIEEETEYEEYGDEEE